MTELAVAGIPVSVTCRVLKHSCQSHYRWLPARVASSVDDATTESFFALLEKNVLDRRTGTSREQLRIAMVTWIERTATDAAANDV